MCKQVSAAKLALGLTRCWKCSPVACMSDKLVDEPDHQGADLGEHGLSGGVFCGVCRAQKFGAHTRYKRQVNVIVCVSCASRIYSRARGCDMNTSWGRVMSFQA